MSQLHRPLWIPLQLTVERTNNVNDAIHSSIATEDSVEHIFWKLDANQGGNYKIRVTNAGGIGDAQDFGLAWWAGEATTLGDFDGDGDVDGRGFLKWQRGESPTPFSSGDLSDWQGNYGFGSLGAVSVPEPSCLALLMGLVFLRLHRD